MASKSATSPPGNSVPDGWRLVRLGDVTQVLMGQSPPGDTVSEWDGELNCYGGLPFIQGNAEFGARTPRPLKWCVRPLKVAELGDMLISVRAPVGETNRTDRSICIGRGLAAIRFFEACRAFGWHIANHRKRALERLTQGSIFPAIGGETLRSLPILLPPLPEQRAIADVLDSIDEAIEKTQAVVAATEQLRDALLHRLLTRGVPGWHSEWKEVRGIGTIPTDWEVVRLGDECIHIGSGITPRGGKSAYVASGIIFLRSQNVHFDGLRLGDVAYISQQTDESMRRSRVLQGDVLLNITGASIGRCTIVPGNLGPANVNQHVCIIRTTEAFNRNFVTKWLSTPRSQREIDDLQSGQSRQGLNYGQIRQIRIVQPPRSEQDRIAEMLAGVDEAIGQGRAETEMLQSLKASAADSLLTGRVRVSNLGGADG